MSLIDNWLVQIDVEQGADLVADGDDVAIVRVSVVDSDGREVPTASNMVQFMVAGPAKLIGVGNGDPSSHEPDKASRRSAFNGLARAIVQTTTSPGDIVIVATSEGLAKASVKITSTGGAKLSNQAVGALSTSDSSCPAGYKCGCCFSTMCLQLKPCTGCGASPTRPGCDVCACMPNVASVEAMEHGVTPLLY